jgi:16S rRNA (guanine966-N2)-methyltransferase
MRIITGKFKKANLYSVPGKTARPTTDYVKELIFSLLDDCSGKRVLDLFAGSGGLGLEALSQGADFVDFVEFSQKSIQTIIKNIEKLHCQESCHIYRKKVNSYLKKTEKTYDFIFMDPPYNKKMVDETLALITKHNVLKKNGRIIVEHSAFENIHSEWKPLIVSERKAGDTLISIIRSQNENL